MKNLLYHYDVPPWGGPEICQATIGTPLTEVTMQSIEPPPPPKTLTFTDGTREAVLDLTGNEVTYSGDLPMGESAKLFWNAVLEDLRARDIQNDQSRDVQTDRPSQSPNNAEEGSFVRNAELWLESMGMTPPTESFPCMFQGMMDDYSDSFGGYQ